MFHHIKDINKDMEMIKKNIHHPRHCTALHQARTLEWVAISVSNA